MDGDFNLNGGIEQKILKILLKYDVDIKADGEMECQWKIIELIKEIKELLNK